ncbi:MAG: phosphoribosylformylglycinamidine cyclo-ligase, partial [Schleiferiaceae bacterium]
AVHCSGGAQTKVLHFLREGKVVKDHLFPVPPLFELIRAESATPYRQMFEVFNMGHRMELYVDSLEAAERAIAVSKSFGVDAQIIGRVEPSSAPEVELHAPDGIHTYRRA